LTNLNPRRFCYQEGFGGSVAFFFIFEAFELASSHQVLERFPCFCSPFFSLLSSQVGAGSRHVKPFPSSTLFLLLFCQSLQAVGIFHRPVVFQGGGPTLWWAVGGRGSCVSLPASGRLGIPAAATRAARCHGSL